MTFERLKDLNVNKSGSLKLKPNITGRLAATEDLGKVDVWSSETLYRHLVKLQGHFARLNETAARVWMDAFFLRATAMTPPDKKLVVSVEQGVSATSVQSSSLTTIGGFIDYAVIMAHADDADTFLTHPFLEMLDGQAALFVSEAKTMDNPLAKHVAQAVAEMFACAKKLQKRIIRGVLSDGQNWIFLIMRMNADGNGARYAESEMVCLMSTGDLGNPIVSHTVCTMLSGIIAYWIEHSNEDIRNDDWFMVKWKE